MFDQMCGHEHQKSTLFTLSTGYHSNVGWVAPTHEQGRLHFFALSPNCEYWLPLAVGPGHVRV